MSKGRQVYLTAEEIETVFRMAEDDMVQVDETLSRLEGPEYEDEVKYYSEQRAKLGRLQKKLWYYG